MTDIDTIVAVLGNGHAIPKRGERCSRSMPAADRLLRRLKINTETGCWEWQGSTVVGYGHFEMKRPGMPRKSYYAHRLAYELFVGDPGGLMVCHKCDNRKCANPDHLFLGTAADNTHDAMSKGRLKFPPVRFGQLPETAKRHTELREHVMRLRVQGRTYREIVKELGVSLTLVWNLANRAEL